MVHALSKSFVIASVAWQSRILHPCDCLSFRPRNDSYVISIKTPRSSGTWGKESHP